MSQPPTSTTALFDVADIAATETSFFRELHPFRALVESVIPEILAARGAAAGLTIWCAACSSGQEPFSVAIAVTEAFPELVRNGRLRIVATDLSASDVERTKAGRFTQREVSRGLPVRHLLRHFQQDGTEWVASRQLRQILDVRVVDLTGSWPTIPKCDIVFLRDVLTSFDPETKRTILERIHGDVLRPAGRLFLGLGENTEHVDDGWTQRAAERSVSYVSPAPPVAPGFSPRGVRSSGTSSRSPARPPSSLPRRSPVRSVLPQVTAQSCISRELDGGSPNPNRSAVCLPLPQRPRP